MQTDQTALTAAFGCHIVQTEADDLLRAWRTAAGPAVEEKKNLILSLFETPDPVSDPLTIKLTPADLDVAARVAAVEASLRTDDSVQVALDTATPPADRIVVQEAATAVSLREAAVQLARAERMPSVSLTSGYGRVAYPSGAFPSWDDLRTNWTIGAVVQVPLLTGGRLRADERIAVTNLEEARLRLRQIDELAAPSEEMVVRTEFTPIGTWLLLASLPLLLTGALLRGSRWGVLP